MLPVGAQPHIGVVRILEEHAARRQLRTRKSPTRREKRQGARERRAMAQQAATIERDQNHTGRPRKTLSDK